MLKSFFRSKPKDNVSKESIISLLKNFFIKNENDTQESYEDRLDSYLYYFLQNELSTEPHKVSTEPHKEKTKVFNELIKFVIETITYKDTNTDNYIKALNILNNDFVKKIKDNAQNYIKPIIENIMQRQRSDKNSGINDNDKNELYTNMNNFVNKNNEYKNLNLYLVFIHLQIIEIIREKMINKEVYTTNYMIKMIDDYLNDFCENNIQPDLNVLKNFIYYCIEDINSTKSKGGKRKSRRKSRKNRRKTNRRRRSRR
jgi:hypothetical protein